MLERLMFNQKPEEAIAELHKQLEKMRADKVRDRLKDVSSDDAFELGYETAIHDYQTLIGPDPRTIDIVTYTQSTEGDTNE